MPNSEDEPFSSPDDDEYEDDEPAIVGGNVCQPEDDDDLVPDISGDLGADAPEVEPCISADREVMPADEPPPEGTILGIRKWRGEMEEKGKSGIKVGSEE